MKKSKTQKHKNIVEALTYAYIRKIKKWMFCPACQSGKMTINKKSTLWTCEDCGYKLSADEFEDDYVFWFCDECGTCAPFPVAFSWANSASLSQSISPVYGSKSIWSRTC